MESAPPSYESATSNDVWHLVAPYLNTSELCRASLVSQDWHRTFAAELWGKPTSFFDLDLNGVLDHLTRFQKTLDFAREHVRAFTFCLHLTPSEALYFDNRSSNWLDRLLRLLPNLQALIVTGVPFFDHASCQAIYNNSLDGISSIKGTLPGLPSTGTSLQHLSLSSPGRSIAMSDLSYGLRLLDASRCSNLTSSSLAGALRRFVSLIYLDLSFTRASRSPVVFRAYQQLYSLKILKLRGVQLKDDDISILGKAIGQQVCHLDVRDNDLRSKAVDELIDLCFDDADTAERTGAGLLDDHHLDKNIYAAYTNEAVNHLMIEDVRCEGITQLKISGNRLLDVALSKLMKKASLRVLDIGRLIISPQSPFTIANDLPSRLSWLRVDHTVFMTSTVAAAKDIRLHPSSLSRVQTLVLTNVPSHSPTDRLAGALIALVKACASEASIALSQARDDYTVPPGQRSQSAILHRSRNLFALQTIVLEVTSSTQPSQRHISLTENEDSEAMWMEGESDFSFFKEEDELSPAKTIERGLSNLTPSRPLVDNLSLLSAFRNARRTAYERAIYHNTAITAEGHWPGTIQIDRQPNDNS